MGRHFNILQFIDRLCMKFFPFSPFLFAQTGGGDGGGERTDRNKPVVGFLFLSSSLKHFLTHSLSPLAHSSRQRRRRRRGIGYAFLISNGGGGGGGGTDKQFPA